MKRIAIFASGNGTNAENIMQYFSARPEAGKVVVLLCNNEGAGVLERAKKFGVETVTFKKSEMENGTKVEDVLKEKEVDFVVLSGFMLKIPEKLVEMYPRKMVNIHPALLPNYGGKGMYGHHVHEAVIAAGEKESGITIHYANEKYDSGDILFQAKCEVKADDTPDTLAARVHELEYRWFPEVIDKVMNGKF